MLFLPYTAQGCVSSKTALSSAPSRSGAWKMPQVRRGHKGKGKTATSLRVAPVLPVDMAGLSALQEPLLPDYNPKRLWRVATGLKREDSGSGQRGAFQEFSPSWRDWAEEGRAGSAGACGDISGT